jgi:hypothetical protein
LIPSTGKKQKQNKNRERGISARDQWLTPAILAAQEDPGLKPAQTNSSRDPISKKKPSQKQGWWSGPR